MRKYRNYRRAETIPGDADIHICMSRANHSE